MKKWCLILCLLTLISGCTQIVPSNCASVEQQAQDCQTSLVQLENANKDLQKQLDEYTFSKLSSTIDLSNWDRFEIVDSLANLNPEFKDGKWHDYEYRGDGSYYYKKGAILPVDPFSDLKYRVFDQEYDKFKLRIFNLAFTGSYALDTYEEYVDMVTRKDLANADFVCSRSKSCRDIDVIKCESQDAVYYSWFEGTHLFVSRENGEEALNTFENFYCYQ